MSDLYHPSLRTSQDKFQAATDKRNMLGVAGIPERTACTNCGKRRTTATGKFTKSGRFICVMCHSPRRVS